MAKKEKTYIEKLAGMNLNQLNKEFEFATDGQKNTKSDFFYWSFEAQLEQIDSAKDKLMKKQIEVLCANYGIRRIINYAEKLQTILDKRKELEKLESNK